MYPYQIKGHYFQKEGENACLNLDPRVSLTCFRETLENRKGRCIWKFKNVCSCTCICDTLTSQASFLRD